MHWTGKKIVYLIIIYDLENFSSHLYLIVIMFIINIFLNVQNCLINDNYKIEYVLLFLPNTNKKRSKRNEYNKTSADF